MRKLLARTGVGASEVELLELNEAFASQSLVVMRELGFGSEIVNVNGGAIAIGHPLGMNGARLVVALLHELRRRGAATDWPPCAWAWARARPPCSSDREDPGRDRRRRPGPG